MLRRVAHCLCSQQCGFLHTGHRGGSEIWSLGGLDSSIFSIDGTNTFRPSSTEHCYSIFSDVAWLSETPTTDRLITTRMARSM